PRRDSVRRREPPPVCRLAWSSLGGARLDSAGRREYRTGRAGTAGRSGATCLANGCGRCDMDYGLFTMPSHPPERSLFAGHRWDLQVLRWADELGFSEAWIGEHHTAPWEPHPSPDLLVAQALLQTSRIRLGPGGFLLPYHHPAELANRVAMLDHLAQARLTFGVAASGRP